MKIGSLLWAGIATVMLVGCASTNELNVFNRHLFKTQACSGASCPVTVTVTENGGVCTPEVDFGVIDLSQGVETKTISWTLSGNYKFSTEPYKYAIYIKSDPKGKFKNANVQAGGQRLVLTYTRGSTAGNSYTYVLSVQRNDDSFCQMPDPFMVD